MRRFLTGLLFILILVACGHEKRMMDESTYIVTKMVELLEAHSSNPPSVLPALREFMLENRSYMTRLRKASDKNGGTLGEKERFRMKVQFVRAIAPLRERLNKVAKVYRGRPETLGIMKEITGSLEGK
jgi:hypothetical protein